MELSRTACLSKVHLTVYPNQKHPIVSVRLFDLCYIPPLGGIQHLTHSTDNKTMWKNNNKALILKTQTMFSTVKSNVPSVVKSWIIQCLLSHTAVSVYSPLLALY